MNIFSLFELVRATINAFFQVLNRCVFSYGDVQVSLGNVFVAMIILLILMGFLWKGAKA